VKDSLSEINKLKNRKPVTGDQKLCRIRADAIEKGVITCPEQKNKKI
jgi:hypothetical protein